MPIISKCLLNFAAFGILTLGRKIMYDFTLKVLVWSKVFRRGMEIGSANSLATTMIRQCDQWYVLLLLRLIMLILKAYDYRNLS